MARTERDEQRHTTGDSTTATREATTTVDSGESSWPSLFSSQGQIPAVETGASTQTQEPTASERAFVDPPKKGEPEIDATKEAMGAHVVQGMNRANVEPGSGGSNDLNNGIHYWYNYKSKCEDAGRPELWKDEYRRGHTQASQFTNPSETGAWMDWELKRGQSASQGIKDWLKGATVAECLSTVVALEIDAFRAAIGDRKFDRMFGSADAKEDKAVPHSQRLHVKAGLAGTPIGNLIKSTKVAEEAQRNGGDFGTVDEKQLDGDLVPGQWYYFYNHPKYLLKHPGGAWQGENAIYMGKNDAGERLWSGLGATATEDHMIDEMVRAYNNPRNDHDRRTLQEDGVLDASTGAYRDPLYDPASGNFPDTVTKKEILASQPFTIGDTERKGGFMASSGAELDEKKVQKIRNER